MNTQKCIIVLGMHRSGTSVLAGILHKSGVSIGKSVAGHSYDNPEGFYENYRIQELNDQILSVFQMKWDDCKSMPPGWVENPLLIPFYKKIGKLLHEEFRGEEQMVIKDPRLCRTLPIWEKAMSERGISIATIIIFRNPTEIAESLKRRNNFSRDKSLILTGSYLLEAEKNSSHLPRLIVDFKDVLSVPIILLNQVQQKFESLDITMNIVDKQIRSFVKQDMPFRVDNEDEMAANTEYNKITNKIISAFKELESTPVDNTKVHLAFVDARHKIERIISQDPISLKGSNEFSKILIDTGEGYSEKSAINYSFEGGRIALTHHFNSLSQKIHSIKIIPVHEICLLKLIKCQLIHEGEEIDHTISINFSGRKENLFFFDNPFPQLIIDFKKPAPTFSLILEIEVIELGEKALSSYQRLNKTKSPLMSAVSAVLMNPFRFIRQLNLSNFKKLRSALRRESPVQILRNLSKLLDRSETQKMIQSRDPQVYKTMDHNAATALNTPACKDENTALTVLYVFPRLPEFDRSSGGRRSFEILKLLSEQCRVCVLSMEAIDPVYIPAFQELNILLFESGTISIMHKQLPHIQAVIYSRYYMFFEFPELKKWYPEARVIIDSVDVHWIREERSIGLVEGLSPEIVRRNKQHEIDVYSKAHAIWVVSDDEKIVVEKELKEEKCFLVPNIHEISKRNYVDSGSMKMLFIGSYSHYPNISAAKRLAREIFPKVLKEIPNAELIIAGSSAPQEIIDLGMLPGVQFAGYIEEADLPALYDEICVAVVPLLAGAGMKGKITEAISFLTPVITNDIGNEGIGLIHNESGFICNEEHEMAKVIISALKREYPLDTIAVNAKNKLQALLDPQNARTAIFRSLVPVVDICIVSWNRLDLLKSCIQNIKKHTVYHNYRIIIFSNACNDGTKEYLEALEKSDSHVSAIYSDINEVFVRPNNRMMMLHPDHDVVLLNNDVTVTPGWLTALYLAAYRHSEIGISGSKLLYPDGRLQEFGAEIYEDGTGVNYGKYDPDPHKDEYSKLKAVPYVSAASMYIKRSTIDRIGVLDDDFHPCYYEDSDYCYRAWEASLATVVTPFSVVYHLEGASAGNDLQNGFKSYQDLNKSKFVAKHASTLKSYGRKIKAFEKKMARILAAKR